MTNEDILTAENTVLGACLCDAPLWGTVLNALHETDLAGDASRAILHAARMLDAEGKTPDAPAVADTVQQNGVERGYLMQLMDVACAPAALDQNIAAIKRSTRLRALAQLGESMVERAHSGEEPNSIAGDAAKVLDELDSSGGGELIDGTAAALDFYNAYDQRTSGRSVYVPVGIAGLDTLFGGGMLNNGLYMDEPSTAAYSGFTVYTRSRSPSPSATSAVMILVVDAIGRRLSAFCSNSVSPVSASITTAARALTAPALGSTSKSASTQNSFFTLHHSPHNKTYSAFTRVGFAGKRGFIRRRTGFPPLRLRPRSCP